MSNLTPSDPRVQQKKPRVLVIDDNLDSLITCSTLLKSTGCETATAIDGPNGIITAREFNPDVVLLDLGMPGLSGFAVCGKIKDAVPTRKPVMIAVTGLSTDEDREKSRKAGFDAHLVKPVEFKTLIETMTSLLETKTQLEVGSFEQAPSNPGRLPSEG